MQYLIALAFILLLASWLLVRYQRITIEQQSLTHLWRQFVTTQQQRNALLREYLKLHAHYLGESKASRRLKQAHEQSYRLLEESFSLIHQSEQMHAIAQSEASLYQILASTRESLLSKADAQQDAQLARIVDELMHMERQSNSSTRIYNLAVERYNQDLLLFPGLIIASMFSMPELPTLSTARAS